MSIRAACSLSIARRSLLPLARRPVLPLARRRLMSSSSADDTAAAKFWAWTTQQRPSWRESPLEASVAFVVFGVTGSTSVALVRPALKKTVGLEGSMREGPWSYRIISLVVVSPIYGCLLVTFGTLAGRHRYFAYMASKIFGRFVPAAVMRRVSSAFALCFPGSVR